MAIYAQAQHLLKAAIEGYVAADRREFPPNNPYARFGVVPGKEEANPEGAAWFFGYWQRSYCRNGEPDL